MEQKKLVRQQALARRNSLDEIYRKEADRAICQQLLELVRKKNCRRVCIYGSIGSEVDTWQAIEALWAMGVETYLPRCGSPGQMDFYRVSAMGQLEEGKFHLREPGAECQKLKEKPDLMVVPAVAYDCQGWRVGYGGGYYDRYLEGSDTPTVGLCYERCLVEQAPREPHDRRVERILTERRE